MKLKWTKTALKQLQDAQDYISKDNPAAAQRVAQSIADAATLLMAQPHMGRSGRVLGTFEWVVKQTPYLIIYRIDGEILQILRVIHSKQSWP